MIVLDTHVWIWWVHGDSNLTKAQKTFLDSLAIIPDKLGVSAISCWEVAKLVEKSRLQLGLPTIDWLNVALNYPGVQLLPLTPEIAAESSDLPGVFHRDPADQIIVATARIHKTDLATSDKKIRRYPHVQIISMG